MIRRRWPSRVWSVGAATVLSAVLLGSMGGVAGAVAPCTDTFTGPTGGSWQTAANWTDSANAHVLPTTSDVACWGTGTTVVSGGAAAADSLQGGSLQLTAGTLTLSSSNDASTVKDLSLDESGSLTANAAVNVTGNFEWGAGNDSPALDATIDQTGGGTFMIDGSASLGGPDFTGGTILTTSPVSITNEGFQSSGAQALTTTDVITLGPNVQLTGLDPSTTFTAAGLASQAGNYGFWDAGLILTGGTTTVPVNGTLEVGSITISGGTFVQDGSTTLGGGGLNTATLTGGTLTGFGVMGNVTNTSGTVAVPSGTPENQLTIDGTYAQGAAGTLAVGLDGTDASLLKLNGSGNQTLAGTLSITDDSGYAPPPAGTEAAQIVLTQTAPISGSFAQLSGPAAALYSVHYANQVVQLYSASSGGSPPAGTSPVDTAPPTITGTPAVGDVLTCLPGTWSPTPTGYAYGWSRDGTPLATAAGSTYAVIAADAGHALTCTVTASDAAGSSLPATSAPVDVPAPVQTTSTGASPSPTGASPTPTEGVPVDLTAPVTSGNPTPGHMLRCSPGTWRNQPSSYAYRWYTGARSTDDAGSAYVVAIGDEGATLTCAVTATNAAGSGAPARSGGIVVAQPGTLRCPQPTGHLGGVTLGRLALGLSRSQARRRLTRYVITHNNFDNFCLYGGWGIRVGYPTAQLLAGQPVVQRTRLQGRSVLALTANPYYALDGARPGMRLGAVAHRLRLAHAFRIGSNDWYLTPGSSGSRGVLKVRGGVIQEVGLANRQLTAGSVAAQRRFLASFRTV